MSDWRDGTIVVVVVGVFLVPVFRLAKILVRNLCTACGFLQPRKKKKVAAAPPMLKGRAALGLERRGVGKVSEGGAGGGGGGGEDDYESDGGGVGGSGKKAKATGQVLLVAKKVRSTGQAPGSTQSDFMQQRAARLDRLAKDKGHNAAKAAWQVWSPPMLELDERGQMGKTRPQSKAQGRLKRGAHGTQRPHSMMKEVPTEHMLQEKARLDALRSSHQKATAPHLREVSLHPPSALTFQR